MPGSVHCFLAMTMMATAATAQVRLPAVPLPALPLQTVPQTVDQILSQSLDEHETDRLPLIFRQPRHRRLYG